MDKVGEIAKKLKKTRVQVEGEMDYHKKHPFDTLQPGDKGFKEVWGGKLKRNEDRMQRNQRDAEEEYREKKEFEKRKVSYNKVHKKWHV